MFLAALTESVNEIVDSVIARNADIKRDILSPILTESDIDLVAAKILLSPSVIDIDSDIVLNVFIKRDMLSPILTESDTDLNADISRDNESPIVTESDIVLSAESNLETLSVIVIDTPVMLLNVDMPLVTESVISYVPCVRSN